jgi:AraC-like DNA-binding protein
MIIPDNTSMFFNGKYKHSNEIASQIHYHRQVEFIYLKRGKLEIGLAGKDSLLLNENDYAIIKPFELHSFRPLQSDNEYILVILPDSLSMRFSSSITDSRVFQSDDDDIRKLIELFAYFETMNSKYYRIYYSVIFELIKFAYHIGSGNSAEQEVMDYISANFTEPITLDSVAAECLTNRSFVSRTVNKRTGMNISKYVNNLRLSKFLEMYLTESKRKSIESVAKEVGFSSTRTFYRAFRTEFGCTPNEYLAEKP